KRGTPDLQRGQSTCACRAAGAFGGASGARTSLPERTTLMSNERIFQEMRDADQIRADMKQNILDRAKTWLGNNYEKGQDLAHESGLMGALNDIYRRCFE